MVNWNINPVTGTVKVKRQKSHVTFKHGVCMTLLYLVSNLSAVKDIADLRKIRIHYLSMP